MRRTEEQALDLARGAVARFGDRLRAVGLTAGPVELTWLGGPDAEPYSSEVSCSFYSDRGLEDVLEFEVFRQGKDVADLPGLPAWIDVTMEEIVRSGAFALPARATPPIVVVDREGRLTICASLGGAEAGLRVRDVESGAYSAFDGDGAVLDVLVEKRAWREKRAWWVPWLLRFLYRDRVRIVKLDRPPEPEALRALLSEAISDADPQAGAALAGMTLAELIARGRDIAASGKRLRAISSATFARIARRPSALRRRQKPSP